MTLIELLLPPFSGWKVIIGLVLLASVIMAITVHEYAHARSAKSHGDDTAESAGRLTLNPLKHYDPVGSTLFLLFGFGWAKPVPINPNRMRNPRLDALKVSLWGPFSNILLAAAFALIVRVLPGLPGSIIYLITVVLILPNLFLAVFNLLPLPPLDGSRIITYLLPIHAANAYQRFMYQYGQILVIGVILLARGVLGGFVGTVAVGIAHLMTGVDLRSY